MSKNLPSLSNVKKAVPESGGGRDTSRLVAQRNQYREILSQLAMLDSGDEASCVQNYNKRETLALLEVLAGDAVDPSQLAAGWRGLEQVTLGLEQVTLGKARGPAVNTQDEAIVSLGHLFYLAGSQMASVLDATLETLLTLLRDTNRPQRQHILVIKALGEVCWCNFESQQRLLAQGGVRTLLECVYGHANSPALARWACHTLAVAVTDNSEIWLLLRDQEALERTLIDFANDSQLWTHWDNNHAAILHGLLAGPSSVV